MIRQPKRIWLRSHRQKIDSGAAYPLRFSAGRQNAGYREVSACQAPLLFESSLISILERATTSIKLGAVFELLSTSPREPKRAPFLSFPILFVFYFSPI